jgi:hypothetical protein
MSPLWFVWHFHLRIYYRQQHCHWYYRHTIFFSGWPFAQRSKEDASSPRRVSVTTQKIRNREKHTGFSVKLVDFGNVREVGFQEWDSNTGGTLEYLAPERAPGFVKVKKATRDIFSKTWNLEYANEYLERLRSLRHEQFVDTVLVAVVETYRKLVTSQLFTYVRQRPVFANEAQRKMQMVVKMLVRKYIVEYVPLAAYISGTQENFDIVERHLRKHLTQIDADEQLSLDEYSAWEREVAKPDVELSFCVQHTDGFVSKLLHAVNEENRSYSSMTSTAVKIRRMSILVTSFLVDHGKDVWPAWRYFENFQEERAREQRQVRDAKGQEPIVSPLLQDPIATNGDVQIPPMFETIQEADNERDDPNIFGSMIVSLGSDEIPLDHMEQLLGELKELQIRDQEAWDFVRPELTADPKWDVFALGVILHQLLHNSLESHPFYDPSTSTPAFVSQVMLLAQPHRSYHIVSYFDLTFHYAILNCAYPIHHST